MSSTSWTEVFAALPDTGFFEVVRHYLGPVSAPFHKPELIKRMKNFFEREEVIVRVMDFIDPEDAMLLTFIAFHKRPTEEGLSRMIPEIRYASLREKLLNLEERLLIWNRNDGKARYYALTPLGETVKETGYLGPGTILGKGVPADTSDERCWLDDNFLNAALAFLNERIPLFRKEGGWRKKSLEILKNRFPVLFHDGRGEERLILAGRALIAAGLALRTDEYLEPRIKGWRELESESPRDRLAIMKARAVAGRSLPVSLAIKAIRLISECIPEGRAFSGEKLTMLFQLGTGGESPLSPSGARRMISHLELMKDLISDENGQLSRSSGNLSDMENQDFFLSITPVGDITLKPGMPLFCDLALSAEPLQVDVATTFRINKERYLKGLDAGITPEKLFAGIEKYSGHPVPSNLRISASEWENDYKTVTLKLGVVLQARGIRRQIIEETGVLDSYNCSQPGEGLWILDPAEEDQWRSALSSIGIDRLPPVLTVSGSRPRISVEQKEASPPYLTWNRDSLRSALCSCSWEAPETRDISGILSDLEKAAESVSLSREEREAFRERLERRIIILPEQIRKGSWRYEVMSAKGLDYRGKLRLIEAALNGRDERLAVTIAAGTSVETILIMPKKLEKEGNDHILAGISLPEEEEVRYKIRKIGFLKRIRSSLF